MGTRGPVGKRTAEKMGHRSKAELAQAQTVRVAGRVRVPAVDRSWHPIAQAWYRSLKESAQSRFYEPSDWQAARYVAEVMTRNLNTDRFSAQLFASVWAAMGELMTTEGARRRLRIEIERVQAAPAVAVLDDYEDVAC